MFKFVLGFIVLILVYSAAEDSIALSLRQPIPDPIVIMYPDGSMYTVEPGEDVYVSEQRVYGRLRKETESGLQILFFEVLPNEKRDYMWQITPLPIDPCINFPEQYECWDDTDDEEIEEVESTDG